MAEGLVDENAGQPRIGDNRVCAADHGLRGEQFHCARGGLKGLFMRQASETKVKYPQLVTVAPSDSDSEDYGWLGEAPQLVEFENGSFGIGWSTRSSDSSIHTL